MDIFLFIYCLFCAYFIWRIVVVTATCNVYAYLFGFLLCAVDG